MVILTAKFAGKCAACGNPIRKGDNIIWEPGENPKHERCPEGKSPRKTGSRRGRKPSTESRGRNTRDSMNEKSAELADIPTDEEAPYTMVCNKNEAAHWGLGRLIRTPDRYVAMGYPDKLRMLFCWKTFYASGGLERGVGADSGWVFTAKCEGTTEDIPLEKDGDTRLGVTKYNAGSNE